MLNPSIEQQQQWREQKKYFAARWAWNRRMKTCPKPVLVEGKLRFINWETWFERMFGENLYSYAERMKKEKHGQAAATTGSVV